MARIVGLKAPSFKAQALVDGEFQDVSLGDYAGRWKILFFYPLDFTFVCPTEIIAFSNAADEFKKNGCDLIACSVDSVFSHFAWTQQERSEGGIGQVNFPILSDIHKEIAQAYGVLNEEGVALRGLFLIDDQDVVQHATINNNSVGRNVQETLRLLKAYQYTAKHGEVCPANWEEGSSTMTPETKGSKSYFKETYQK